MFAPRPERPATLEVFVDGVAVLVPEGASAAAAVLLAGAPLIRETPVSGAPRLPSSSRRNRASARPPSRWSGVGYADHLSQRTGDVTR